MRIKLDQLNNEYYFFVLLPQFFERRALKHH